MRSLLLLTLAPWMAAAIEVPFSFERNQGQADPSVKYVARGKGYALLLEDRQATLTLPAAGRSLRMSLAHSLPPKTLEGLEPLQQRTNYFIGQSPADWKRNVPNYARVQYKGVYPGIDLVYHSLENQLEYDFIVAPGSSPQQIELQFAGADSIAILPSGELSMKLGTQTLIHKAPVAYQEWNGRRHLVAVKYLQRPGGGTGFALGAYDTRRPLVIDPVIAYSTYLGGNRADFITGMAVDSEGAVYVTGQTVSLDFPTKGVNHTPFQGAVSYGFISKFKPGGEDLVYSTIIGGSSNTTPYAITVDDEGNAYVTGRTGARNFPLANAVQSTQPGLNIGFVLKLNPAGDKLLFSTYHGGERNDTFNAIAIDANKNIYVTGQTTSTTFPLVNAWQSQLGGSSQDAFVAKYQAPNYRLAYSSYFGGTGVEEGHAIKVDSVGSAYIAGATRSPNMATPGAYQTRYGSTEDAFIAKIHPNGEGVAFYTYLGGNGDDIGHAIALDANGDIWVAGSTVNTSFPTTENALQRTLNGNSDAFFAKLNNNGSALLYSTYYGGSGRTGSTYNESANAIAIDREGAILIAGVTRAQDFPGVRPLQAYGGGDTDAFLIKYNPTTNTVDFSSPFGGSSNENANALAVDRTGAVYFSGETFSTNFPIKAAYRSTFGASSEGFVTKVCDPRLIADMSSVRILQVQGAAPAAAQTLRIEACAAIPFSLRIEGDFLRATPSSGTTNASLQVSADARALGIGDYPGKLIFTSPDAVNSPFEVPVLLRVNPPPPTISAAGVVNAASSKVGPVAPGELVVIYGTNLGPAQLAGFSLTGENRFSNDVSGTRVLFDGIPAPIVYTSSGQVSAIVPYGVANRPTTQLQLEYRGAGSNSVTLQVGAASPALFTANSSGTGPGAILNQDYSVNTPANGADKGATVLLYATGEGVTDPGSTDGQIIGGVLARPKLAVSVTIGGQPAVVDYAGSAPGLVAGVFQLNVRIPTNIASGNQPVVVTVGNNASPSGVTVSVR
jgi:uncharacterized protein (TIGR03437 family)